jgi:hypothetical protein
MTVRIFCDENGSPYSLDDDPLVLPAGTTEADRAAVWQAMAELKAFWVLYPEA